MRGLFGKYVALIAGLVTLVLLASSALGFWFFAGQNERQLVELQHEKALAAATRIELFIRDIEHEMGWTALPKAAGDGLAQRRLEFLKLLRQVPAVTDVAWLDEGGRERLRLSRIAMDREDSGIDLAASPAFRAPAPGRPWFGPVYFRKGSEPYMTIATRSPDPAEGVTVAEVNLKFVWDVVSAIRVGRTGLAYVMDGSGQLVAHPDISLVLQKTSLPPEEQAAAAASGRSSDGRFVRDLQGREVLSANAPVPALGWTVFVDLPRAEALQPLVQLLWRGAAVLVVGVLLSVLASMMLARRLLRPIRALQAGAQDIGAGRLDQRIAVRTGDELEALAAQFNTMSSQLRDSYATLEQKVAERTASLAQAQRELLVQVGEADAQRQRAESASVAKSRFLAAASHDLRQPMHALNLYLGALARHELSPASQRLLENLRQCAQTMDGLFEGLLDISRLDANAVAPVIDDVAIGPLLERIRVEMEPQARAKGLQLKLVACRATVRTDAALLARIVRNLVSNAVRYTDRGKVLIGCRRQGGRLQVQVHDTGVGIAPDQQSLVFEEFYQVANAERDRGKGLGLGLSIVQRLAKLLDAGITLRSQPGRGSTFGVSLPLGRAASAADPAPAAAQAPDVLRGKLLVVVDDESVVRDATCVLLQQWGCDVVPAGSGAEAIARLAASSRVPDVLVCDYRLRPPENGLLVMEALREEFNRQIPALVITGDVLPESLELEESRDAAVLHKPVSDALLHATLARLLALGAAVP
jgi:signal transduction histidine kinase